MNGRCRKTAVARVVPRLGSRQADASGRPWVSSSAAPATAARGSASSASSSLPRRPGLQLAVLVEQQAVVATGRAKQRGVVLRLARTPVELDQLDVPVRARGRRPPTRRSRRCRARGSPARTPSARGALDRVEALEQPLAVVRVDHAVGEKHPDNDAVRVQIVDPSANTPPYDHALQLGARGGRGRGGAGHEPLRPRPAPATGRLPARRVLLPAQHAPGPVLHPRPPHPQARRARARHAPLPAPARAPPTSSTSSGSRSTGSTATCSPRAPPW